MICQQLGYRTVMIDRVSHPRFAIGESSTPFSNLLLEEIAIDFNLPQLAGFIDWGHWQAAHPDIACGLKRGFSFFHHERDRPFVPDTCHSNELLVAASPRDSLGDTHWYRSELDAHLVREAAKMGVEFFDRTQLMRIDGLDSTPLITLALQREGTCFDITSRYVIDATGPRGALHSALKSEELCLESLPGIQTLFAHFRNVARWDSRPGNLSAGALPYPPDDAAVHHIFEGGWIWILRFNNGIVSAGISALDSFANEFGLSEGGPAWQRILKAFPSIGALFDRSAIVEPFRFQRHSSFRSSRTFGRNWTLLPAAAGFVDPLLSTGFALNLLGITRLGAALRKHGLGGGQFELEVAEMARLGGMEIEAVSHLIGALFRTMGDFDRFRALSLLYFAALSFSEAAWRLGRKSEVKTFLLSDRPVFARQLKEICARAADDNFSLAEAVAKAIAPINVAGLGNAERNHWYSVDSRDLLASHQKLGVTREAIEAFLKEFDM